MLKLSNKLKNLFAKSRPTKVLLESSRPKKLKNLLLDFYPWLKNKKIKKIIIVGAAPEGYRLLKLCNQNKIKVLGVCDKNNKKYNKQFGQLRVQSVETAAKKFKSLPFIIASHKGYLTSNKLKRLKIQKIAPFAVLQVLFPKQFKPHFFYKKWFNVLSQNKKKILDLFSMLSDNKSKKTLIAILCYRLTFQDKYLNRLIEKKPYFSKDIVRLNKNATYVDGGAFDGDSIRQFIIKAKGKYKKIIAFEPDPKTFQKLSKKIQKTNNSQIFNLGLSNKQKLLRFNSDQSRAAMISKNGNIKIKTDSIDNILDGQQASIIKLNIEGSEPFALDGAKMTIKKYNPILSIAAYHNPSHLWDLAFQMKKINPKYKIFLRQHDYGCVETVLYARL